MVSQHVKGNSINELLPVVMCSGAGDTAIIPANQPDEPTASRAIRDACVGMGSAAGATGRPVSGRLMREVSIPNTYSLAWRLGRAVAVAQQKAAVSTVSRAIIEAAGGPKSARLVFQGKIRSVESTITTTAHSLGRVTVEKLGDGEAEMELDTTGSEYEYVVIPFMNENLSLTGVQSDGTETVSLTDANLNKIAYLTATGSCHSPRPGLPTRYVHWRGHWGSRI